VAHTTGKATKAETSRIPSRIPREEPRAHVHVQHASGEAKFWLDPRLELAQNYGLTSSRLNTALRIIQEHQDEILAAWAKHFGG
jgi:hypothetical protein